MNENIKRKLKDLADYEATEECRYRIIAVGLLLLRPNKFKKFARKLLLKSWRQIGWKRFFIVDWWRLYLGMKSGK